MTFSGYLYAAAALVGVLFLLRWERKNVEFDLSDMVTGDNGKVSLRKFGALVALFTSTWGFVDLVNNSKLTEWYFGTYMAVWVAQKIATDVMGKSDASKPTS